CAGGVLVVHLWMRCCAHCMLRGPKFSSWRWTKPICRLLRSIAASVSARSAAGPTTIAMHRIDPPVLWCCVETFVNRGKSYLSIDIYNIVIFLSCHAKIFLVCNSHI